MFNIEGSLLNNFIYLFFQETVAYYLRWNDPGKVKVNGKNYKLNYFPRKVFGRSITNNLQFSIFLFGVGNNSVFVKYYLR